MYLRSKLLLFSINLAITCLLCGQEESLLEQAKELADKNPIETLRILTPYLSEDYTFESDEKRFKVLYAASNANSLIGHFHEALDQSEVILGLAGKDDFKRCEALLLKGKILFHLGLHKEGELTALNGLNTAKLVDSQKLIATALNLIGGFRIIQGDVENAINYYIDALELMDALGNKIDAVKIRANLGIIYAQTEEYEGALTYLEPAFSYSKEIKDLQMQLVIGTNLASTYGSLGKIKRGKQMYADALVIGKQLGIDSMLAGIYINLSDLNIREQDWVAALQNASKAYEMSLKQDDPSSIAVALVNMGKSHAGNLDFDQTFHYFDQAMTYLEQADANIQIRKLLGYFAEYYAKAARYKEAYTYARRFEKATSDIITQENLAKLQEIRELHDTEQKELKIKSLEGAKREQDLELAKKDLESEVNNSKLEKVIVTRNALALLVLSSFLLMVLLVNRYKLKTRANRELKQLHVQLNKINHELKELHDRKNRLLATVSHDLRNPLNGIIGLMDVLREEGSSIKEDTSDEIFGMISLSANRAMSIVNNLLDAERIKSGKLDLTLVPCKVFPLVEALISENSMHAQLKDQRLHCKIDPNVKHIQINGEEGAIMQIFSNILSNAIKYAPMNSDIEIHLSGIGDSIRFGVKDQGPGINIKDQQKLFLPFSTTEQKTTGGEKSVGLGLCIVKELTEAMGGKVYCVSEQGNGCLFYVDFPVLKATTAIKAN